MIKTQKRSWRKIRSFSLVLNQYSPSVKYVEYKQKIDDINEKVEQLIFIKDSLMIVHKTKFIKDICY